MRAYDEIDFLEAVLEIKRSQVSRLSVLRSPFTQSKSGFLLLKMNRIPSCCLLKWEVTFLSFTLYFTSHYPFNSHHILKRDKYTKRNIGDLTYWLTCDFMFLHTLPLFGVRDVWMDVWRLSLTPV